ncbi:origin recognition complex subunit 6-like [Corticium candelabrum]|uniref:origin recognition complex subunit 6-like n=1 Tax=Corticium candelabrum TaxID=121492 RepID=UPI002E262F2E|nr:origin recognition complex subunit 6-like [Corticium candelabrum]
MEKDLLRPIARRLGIRSCSVFNRTVELLRLVELKCCQSAVMLSNNCRAVVCLELAAEENNEPLSRTEAIRISGQKKKTYESAYQTIEKMLGLRARLGIHELAVQCGCSEVRELAQSLMTQYEKNIRANLSVSRQNDLDLSQPIFAIAALQVAAKKQKVWVDKKRLVSHVGRKKAALTKIISEMEECVKQIDNKKQQKQSSQLFDCLEVSGDEENDVHASKKQCIESEELLLEDYEIWKARILAAAEQAIVEGKGHIKPDTQCRPDYS